MLLVGLVTGCVAGVIDIGASWMTDLKVSGLLISAFLFASNSSLHFLFSLVYVRKLFGSIASSAVGPLTRPLSMLETALNGILGRRFLLVPNQDSAHTS